MRLILVFIAVAVLFSAAAAQEQAQLSAGPIHLESDGLERIGDGNKFTFRGNVRGRSDNYTLGADAIDVYFEKDNSINRIVCRDNVTFGSGTISASADKAEVNQLTKTITMTGNAKIRDGSTNLTGHIIVINYETKKFSADGGSSGRVRVIFDPGTMGGKE